MNYKKLMISRLSIFGDVKLSSMSKSELKKYIKELENNLNDILKGNHIILKDTGNHINDNLTKNIVNLLDDTIIESWEINIHNDVRNSGELKINFIK